MQVRLSGRERTAWRTAAASLGLDLSELVRDAVRTRLAERSSPEVVQVEERCGRQDATAEASG